MFRGVWTALVTPMDRSGQLDLTAYRRILLDQKEAGVAGVIPCGTTGESPTLTYDEKKILIQTALETLRGSATRVIAGTGSNNTRETVEFSKWASDQGVAGVLVVTPYYNKPTQAGLEAHFKAVADAVSCEVMLYHVPGRASVSMKVDTVAHLAKHPRISSIKEASGNLGYASELIHATRQLGKPFHVLCGDDVLFLPMLSIGATGVVSVASNLIPRPMVAMQESFEAGNSREALRIHQFHTPIFRDLFIETNPVPIKAAMEYAGWCSAGARLPLVPLTEKHLACLHESLQLCGISGGSK